VLNQRNCHFQELIYNSTSFDNEENLANHKLFMSSMNIQINDDYDDLFTLYWIRKLHKNPYIEKYIAGSSTCSTKELYIAIVSAVKEGRQSYCVSVIKYIHVVTSIERDPF
jgi:hypothetical protein